jgi:hypothetical protein
MGQSGRKPSRTVHARIADIQQQQDRVLRKLKPEVEQAMHRGLLRALESIRMPPPEVFEDVRLEAQEQMIETLRTEAARWTEHRDKQRTRALRVSEQNGTSTRAMTTTSQRQSSPNASDALVALIAP